MTRPVPVTAREPSRAVTCATCRRSFQAARSDARYCSAACRQRAARARAELSDLEQRIDQARELYWSLVRQLAQAKGISESAVNTSLAQYVTEDGDVYMGGAAGGMGEGARLAGHAHPVRPGWSAWGLEAAGPPFSPPTTYMDDMYRRRLTGKRSRAGERRRQDALRERDDRRRASRVVTDTPGAGTDSEQGVTR